MTNHQAVNLRPGARIHREQPSDDNAIFVVERVAHPANRAGYRAARRERLTDHAPRGAPRIHHTPSAPPRHAARRHLSIWGLPQIDGSSRSSVVSTGAAGLHVHYSPFRQSAPLQRRAERHSRSAHSDTSPWSGSDGGSPRVSRSADRTIACASSSVMPPPSRCASCSRSNMSAVPILPSPFGGLPQRRLRALAISSYG